jgi:hypothetical protein
MPDAERTACCLPRPDPAHFNPRAVIPHGVTSEHVRLAMNEFLDFLEFVNTQLNTKQIPRLETFLMPANFSSIVGEFMTASIPKHSRGVVKNRYHNGHPDLIPAGRYPGDSLLHADEGIEVKASRYLKSWQGHNAEDVWLMVFVFEANRARDEGEGRPPMPFHFLKVVGAKLDRSDWLFAGRSETSRRTITASVTDTGYAKMERNWIYRLPGISSGSDAEATSESSSGSARPRRRGTARTPRS